MSDIVTFSGNHQITAPKKFHSVLLVDDRIEAGLVNGNKFNQQTVLLKNFPQHVSNPVQFLSPIIRTTTLNADKVNGEDINLLFKNIVQKDKKSRISTSVEFPNELEVLNLYVNESALLNGHNIDEMFEDAVWLNKLNQTLGGDFIFHSDVQIDGNLFTTRINHKRIPDDLIIANQKNVIKGIKTFQDSIVMNELKATKTFNEIEMDNGKC